MVRNPRYRLYTARWAPATEPSRPPATVSGRDHKPAADPAAAFLPLEPGELDIPRGPLRHDRASIAARVLAARLRTARRTGRLLHSPAAHQPAEAPEQLLLFAHEQPSTAHARPAVDLAALRTDLEVLELTAYQLSQLGRVGQRLVALRKAANWLAHQAAPGGAPGTPDAPGAHRQDAQQAHRQVDARAVGRFTSDHL